MSIIRISHDKHNPYVLLNKKTLEIPTLSWEAKGLWSYLLSKPDDWNISVLHLTKNFGAGRTKVYRILKELIEHRLCKRAQPRYINKEGKKSTGSMEYTVFESPFSEQKQLSGNQEAGFQETENRDALISNEYLISNEKERKSRNSEKFDVPFSSEIKDLCIHLRNRICTHSVNTKDPYDSPFTWNQWHVSMERLIRIDKRTPHEIKDIIDFAHDDDFWCQNILSPASLRRNYDKLLMQKSKRKLTPKERTTENKEFAKKIIKILKGKKTSLQCIIEISPDYMELREPGHPYPLTLKFSDKDFKGKLEHELSKREK